MPSRKTRLKDIARMAGVSIGTIDRVIHNRGEVAEKTKLTVQRILEETNYSPNLMAQVLKLKKRIHLVSLLPSFSGGNSFWKKHATGMIRAIEELNVFPVTLTQVTFDIQGENDFLAKAGGIIDLKPDGVLIAPIFKSESISFCSRLTDAGIPFAFVDGFISDTDFLAYTGEDIFHSGRVAGQLTDMITSAASDILIVSIAKNLHNIHHLEKRTEGFLSFLRDLGKNNGRKMTLNIPDTSKVVLENLLDKTFQENPSIETVFITGSRSYLIASYLEKKGLRSINLIGYDLTDQNVKYLKKGITKFLIGQRPEEQTYKGIKKLIDYVSFHKVPEKIEYLPVDIVTSENVDFFI
jgi:LacI family transcriptional regulator